MDPKGGKHARGVTRRVDGARATLVAALLAAMVLAGVLSGATASRVGASDATAAVAEPYLTATAGSAGPAGRIKHVVVFYQENHSFDETLGPFCKAHKNRCDGYVGDVKLSDGVVAPMTKSPDIVPSVWHNVIAQER